MTDEYRGPGSASWEENERRMQREHRRMMHSAQLHMVRGYQAALTDIATARDNGGWEAVEEWLQKNLDAERYQLGSAERVEGTGQIAKGPFVDEFQRRLRAVLRMKTAWFAEKISESEFVVISRGSNNQIVVGAVLDYGDFYASCEYEEPGAWSKLLADLEAVQ